MTRSVSAITSNADHKMGAVIGGLWEKLYQVGVNTARISLTSIIGLYSDYSKDQYCVTAGNRDWENADIDSYIAFLQKRSHFTIKVKCERFWFNATEAKVWMRRVAVYC